MSNTRQRFQAATGLPPALNIEGFSGADNTSALFGDINAAGGAGAANPVQESLTDLIGIDITKNSDKFVVQASHMINVETDPNKDIDNKISTNNIAGTIVYEIQQSQVCLFMLTHKCSSEIVYNGICTEHLAIVIRLLMLPCISKTYISDLKNEIAGRTGEQQWIPIAAGLTSGPKPIFPMVGVIAMIAAARNWTNTDLKNYYINFYDAAGLDGELYGSAVYDFIYNIDKYGDGCVKMRNQWLYSVRSHMLTYVKGFNKLCVFNIDTEANNGDAAKMCYINNDIISLYELPLWSIFYKSVSQGTSGKSSRVATVIPSVILNGRMLDNIKNTVARDEDNEEYRQVYAGYTFDGPIMVAPEKRDLFKCHPTAKYIDGVVGVMPATLTNLPMYKIVRSNITKEATMLINFNVAKSIRQNQLGGQSSYSSRLSIQ